MNKQVYIQPTNNPTKHIQPINNSANQSDWHPKHVTAATHEKECSEEEKWRNGEQGKGLTMKEEGIEGVEAK